MNNQEECSFSELELFERPVLQSNMLNEKFEKIYPITKLKDSGPIEIPTSNDTSSPVCVPLGSYEFTF